jgi:hypothetical protein
MLLENKSDIRYVHYMMMYVLHVKWFLKELLVSLIMPLLSSKSVDEKINPFGNLISTRIKFFILKPKYVPLLSLPIPREAVTTFF